MSKLSLVDMPIGYLVRFNSYKEMEARRYWIATIRLSLDAMHKAIDQDIADKHWDDAMHYKSMLSKLISKQGIKLVPDCISKE